MHLGLGVGFCWVFIVRFLGEYPKNPGIQTLISLLWKRIFGG